MPADATKYLWDAREAAARIARFAQGKTLDDYLADELLRAAIERQFTILGEALGQLRQLDEAMAARRLADSDNLPPPEVIAQEIVDDLEAALEQFRLIASDLSATDTA